MTNTDISEKTEPVKKRRRINWKSRSVIWSACDATERGHIRDSIAARLNKLLAPKRK